MTSGAYPSVFTLRFARGSTLSLLNIPAYDSSTESDVEQKFLFPLLTHPSFMGIPAKAILTKKSMGSLSFVEKTSLPRNYIPDYMVFFHGLPVCVVEAKAPDVPVAKAIEEARVYADILNRQFPTKLNPIEVVVGCNGRELVIGPVDSNEFTLFSTSDLVVGSAKLDELRRKLSIEVLSSIGERHHTKIAAVKQLKPSKLLGSQLFLDRVKPNALAPYLSPLYEMFFRAEDPEKIRLILDQAYVDTAELREYDQVIHSMLRQVERALPEEYRTIQTDRRNEYTLTPALGHYEGDVTSRGRIHLIIGSRGSGKSLFIARFFTHLMSPSLKKKAVWCAIDFNRAPSSIDSIEDFICEKFLETAENLQFDPHSLDGLNKVFAVEINRLTKGPLAAISDDAERRRALSTELLRLSGDKRGFALRLGRYITGDANRPLIIAFDNVDRRESGQQLHIFQAAQWFRSETRAFALLTLRDVTFERFKSEPPLDAFAQISNFYIRPPRFALVLQKRLRLAIEIGLKDYKIVEQSTESGMRFKYSKEQLGMFLQTVYDALFGGEQQVGRIVDALAERDVREALGMFARMLSSGHFNADRVIRIGTGGGADIKQDMLIKILMRADYKVYAEEAGFVKNIFSPADNGFGGNIFLSAELLGFFAEPQNSSGRLGGFRSLEELLSDMASMGFGEDEVRDRVHAFIKHKLLTYDGEDIEAPRDNDLIKITPSGFIHLRSLPHFVEYLASVALYTPFDDPAVAKRIAAAWEHANRYSDLTFAGKHEVASMLAEYMVRHKNRLDAANPLFKERSRESEQLVRALTHTVNVTRNAAAAVRAKTAADAAANKARRQPYGEKRRKFSKPKPRTK